MKIKFPRNYGEMVVNHLTQEQINEYICKYGIKYSCEEGLRTALIETITNEIEQDLMERCPF